MAIHASSQVPMVIEAASSRREGARLGGGRLLACRWAALWELLAGGRWALYVVYFGAAWLLTALYWQLTQQLETATIHKFIAGEADRPFGYRVLMPWLLGAVSGLNGISNPKLADMAVRVAVLFGLMLLLRRWLRHFVDPLLADVSPLLLGVMLPWSFVFYWPYDFAGILLWTACLVALVERRYPLYLLLFALGTLNRETTLFLIGIFAVTQWEGLGVRRTLRWTGAQAAIWLALFLGLRLLIHPPAGEALEVHLLANLGYLAFGPGLGPVEHWMKLLSSLGFLWLLVPWHWSRKSPFLRRACWVLPFHALTLLFVARLVETRVWHEWLPIVMALAGQSLMEFGRREQRRKALVGS